MQAQGIDDFFFDEWLSKIEMFALAKHQTQLKSYCQNALFKFILFYAHLFIYSLYSLTSDRICNELLLYV
jgi:hypothetical protein